MQVVQAGVGEEMGGRGEGLGGPMGRWGHTATMITESTMMVLGGQADDDAHQATLGDLYKFDFGEDGFWLFGLPCGGRNGVWVWRVRGWAWCIVLGASGREHRHPPPPAVQGFERVDAEVSVGMRSSISGVRAPVALPSMLRKLFFFCLVFCVSSGAVAVDKRPAGEQGRQAKINGRRDFR